MTESGKRGRTAESWCAKQLLHQGFTILERNYAWQGRGEIDLIAVRGTTVHFIEVKARRDLVSFGGPAGAISSNKVHRMQLCALQYLQDRKMDSYNCCLTAALIRLDETGYPTSCIFREINPL